MPYTLTAHAYDIYLNPDADELRNVIVGTGPLTYYLHKLARDLKIEENVQFKGDVSDPDLMQYYEEADMFILPCIIADNGDLDGIPVAIMEAMAMELPVVSTMVSGIPELVEDGISGILVSPKDDKAIAKSIITLWKNRELSVEMGRKGREIIEQKFNITFEVHKLSGVFDLFAKNRSLGGIK